MREIPGILIPESGTVICFRPGNSCPQLKLAEPNHPTKTSMLVLLRR